MSCDDQIHDDLKSMGESECTYCEQILVEVNKEEEPCCDEKDLETVNGMDTCLNCGLVHGYAYEVGYFDFHDNMHRIRQKSVYHRKYHIDNVLYSISSENNIQLTYHQTEKIYKEFIEIDSVLHKVNDGRKRMISIKYVIKQLFKMLGPPYKDIFVTKSKRTLTYYEKYWKKVKLLVGNRIQSIINV